MDAQYFVYTRGYDIANDYKLMFSPSNDFCPDDVRKYFLQQARGVINIELYSGNLEKPRWLYSRKSEFTLWGVGIMNTQLSDENNSDYANRPVRGFFGLIIKGSPVNSLPFDISFFKDFYKSHIVSLWNAPKEGFKQKGVIVEDCFGKYNTISPQSSSLSLNTNEKKTIIWTDTFSPIEMFSTALNINRDLSCVWGLEDRSHAYNHDYYFYNVIINGIKETEEKVYMEKKVEPIIEPTHLDLVKESQRPKKDYRPKIMMLIGIIAIVLIIIAMCSKGTQTSKHTTSGEKTMKQNQNSPDQLSDTLLIKQEKQPN